MNAQDFTEDARVVHAIDSLVRVMRTKKISDIVDDEGHQYVDLVMEGGGVLGIALVGYTYALEQAGIRFLGVGGTSAGSINALLVAAAAPPADEKSTLVLAHLAALDMFEFVDGDSDARDFVRAMVEGAGSVKMAWKGMQIIDNLRDDLGLNPGRAFTKWLTKTLRDLDIRSQADLDARMSELPDGLRTRDGKKLTKRTAGSRLAIVAAEITTETKVVFPDMADLFFENVPATNPALYARASMSIPLFFHPFKIKSLPKGADAVRRWKRKAGYTGNPPKGAVFVDGGIMSNFPIDIFHGTGVPTAPTFGVKLGTDRTAPHRVDTLPRLLGAIFNSARHCADYDYILRNPDCEDLVASIGTRPHNWLNFFIEDEDKIDLFVKGVLAAVDFVKGFNWAAHKKKRA